MQTASLCSHVGPIVIQCTFPFDVGMGGVQKALMCSQASPKPHAPTKPLLILLTWGSSICTACTCTMASQCHPSAHPLSLSLTGYRESAAFLQRAADQLEAMLQNSQSV